MNFDSYLTGVLAVSSVSIGVFFLRYWKESKDTLFLAFSVAFVVEGLKRTSVLLLQNPNEGSPRVYLLRCFSFLVILFGIVKANISKRE